LAAFSTFFYLIFAYYRVNMNSSLSNTTFNSLCFSDIA